MCTEGRGGGNPSPSNPRAFEGEGVGNRPSSLPAASCGRWNETPGGLSRRVLRRTPTLPHIPYLLSPLLQLTRRVPSVCGKGRQGGRPFPPGHRRSPTLLHPILVHPLVSGSRLHPAAHVARPPTPRHAAAHCLWPWSIALRPIGLPRGACPTIPVCPDPISASRGTEYGSISSLRV